MTNGRLSNWRRCHLWLRLLVITAAIGHLTSPATFGLMTVMRSWSIALCRRARMVLISSILRKGPFRGNFGAVVKRRIRRFAKVLVWPVCGGLSSSCLTSLLWRGLVLKHIEGQVHVWLWPHCRRRSSSQLRLFYFESPLFNCLSCRSRLRICDIFTLFWLYAW